MKRFSLLFAVTAMLLFSRPALAVNLHNGAIVVKNETTSGLYLFFSHSQYAGLSKQNAYVGPGKTFITDACCFAAGSPYGMRTFRSGGGQLADFHFWPHLCNRNGIPYGYAVIVVNENNTIKEIDHHSCY